MAIEGLEKIAERTSLDLDEIYERNINVAVTRINEDTVRTKASLLDLNHNMRVDLIVRVKDREILEARCQMVKTPFKVCAATGHRIKSLVGLKIERGIMSRMRPLLSGPSGCTHLNELATEAVRMSSNVIMGFATGDEIEWRERKISDDEFIDRAREFLKDSCLPFSAGLSE
ncbi:MAG: DUF2889 domain-containing protein [Candidatus Electryonea clarkiae]|nr:DUF2889 domain-containing protein [Candidatus Electryonea clarkiae]MDP8287615.1 DUF2889 domain-containing protein [Candidatus Electryonea clarkiae]